MTLRESIVAALLALSAVTQYANASDQSSVEKIIKETVERNFPEAHLERVQSSPIAGFYEVVSDGEIAYVNKDATVLFAGRLIDLKTKEDLTAKSLNKMNSIEFNSLPFDSAVKIVKGKGTRKLAVFSDPLCPFCAQLEDELKTVDDVTVYVFLFPLEQLHPGATKLAKNIWCAEDKSAAWMTWMRERKSVDKDLCANSPLDAVSELAVKLRINSTPTLFFESGSRGSGAIPAVQIEQGLRERRQSMTNDVR